MTRILVCEWQYMDLWNNRYTSKQLKSNPLIAPLNHTVRLFPHFFKQISLIFPETPPNKNVLNEKYETAPSTGRQTNYVRCYKRHLLGAKRNATVKICVDRTCGCYTRALLPMAPNYAVGIQWGHVQRGRYVIQRLIIFRYYFLFYFQLDSKGVDASERATVVKWFRPHKSQKR